MINKLRELNIRLLEKYKDNPKELKKQELIKEMLEYDDLFFQIKIEEAYGILRDLEIDEKDLKGVYIELLSKKN